MDAFLDDEYVRLRFVYHPSPFYSPLQLLLAPTPLTTAPKHHPVLVTIPQAILVLVVLIIVEPTQRRHVLQSNRDLLAL